MKQSYLPYFPLIGIVIDQYNQIKIFYSAESMATIKSIAGGLQEHQGLALATFFFILVQADLWALFMVRFLMGI